MKKQGKIIGRLNAGSVITVGEDGYPKVIPPEDKPSRGPYSNEAFTTFQRLASSTGGIMGLSPSSKSLPLVFEKISDHILSTVQPNESLDIGFVLDTTSSMMDDIEQVKQNLIKLLGQLKTQNANTVRVALMEYRDKNDIFLNRINTDFTSDLGMIEIALKDITVDGGDNVPEAVFDALLSAKDDLSWGQDSKRVVILISDAPPHPKTVNGLHDETDDCDQYQAMDIKITLYPIITNAQ